jgi:isoquinoline 1-oxidoreductase subunit beta
MPGVLEVVTLPHAVGVVGESVEAVFAARDALEVDWANAAGLDSESALDAFAERAADLEEEGLSYHAAGDMGEARTLAERTSPPTTAPTTPTTPRWSR